MYPLHYIHCIYIFIHGDELTNNHSSLQLTQLTMYGVYIFIYIPLNINMVNRLIYHCMIHYVFIHTEHNIT